MTPARAVCAWCGKEMGVRPQLKPGTITHGMCGVCEIKINSELDAKEAREREGKKPSGENTSGSSGVGGGVQ